MAEAEKLRSEAWTNRVNRSKLRMKEADEGEDEAEAEVTVGSEVTETTAGDPETASAAEGQR